MKGSGPKFIKLVSAPTDDSVKAGQRPRRICYVDDSRTSAYVTKKILTEFGYHVDHFPTAEPAIVALLESDYDLLLTDLLLATGGMDGDDLVRFLRMSGHPKKKLMPVIVITGSSDKDTLLKIYEAGANGVLVKPITGEELNERIRSLIPEPAQPAPSNYAIEIHDEHVDASATEKPARKTKPAASKAAPAVDEPPPDDHAPEPEVEARPRKDKTPVMAFGAKKNQLPAEPERDAASVIAELRAKAREGADEEIPTLTLVAEPIQLAASPVELPHSPPPPKSEPPTAAPEKPAVESRSPARESKDDRIEFHRDESPVLKLGEAGSEEELVLRLDDSGPVAAAPPKPERRAKPAPKPESKPEPAAEEPFATDSKAIITALDIQQDFADIQDDFYQPSIMQTVTETVKRYKVLAVAAIASLVIIGWSMMGQLKGSSTTTVDMVRAQVGSLHQSITVNGKVVSKMRVDVSASSSGNVSQVYVKEGDKVRKGQQLVQLENDELGSEVKRAEGNLVSAQEETALASKTVTRMRRALELGAVSRQAVEEAEASLNSARAKEAVAKEQVRSARNLQEKLTLTAPFDGTVTARLAQSGQFVKVGDVLFSIVDLGQREIEARVDASDSASISVGQEVELSTDAFPDHKWTETVTRVAQAANKESSSNTVNVYISMGKEAPMLKIGQQVDGEIRIVSSDNAVKLPIGALIQRNGKTWVALVEDGRVHFTPVVTGMEDLTHVEITQGIRAGEEVAVPRGGNLQEGDKVVIGSTAR